MAWLRPRKSFLANAGKRSGFFCSSPSHIFKKKFSPFPLLLSLSLFPTRLFNPGREGRGGRMGLKGRRSMSSQFSPFLSRCLVFSSFSRSLTHPPRKKPFRVLLLLLLTTQAKNWASSFLCLFRRSERKGKRQKYLLY